jgi:hypothetical protein
VLYITIVVYQLQVERHVIEGNSAATACLVLTHFMVPVRSIELIALSRTETYEC